MKLEPYAFYNEDIWQEVKSIMNGQEIPYTPESFYTVEHGTISHKAITGLYKSKFKADTFKIGSGSETKRGLKFSGEYLDRLSIYYDVPNEIVILQNNTTKADNQPKQDSVHNDATENESWIWIFLRYLNTKLIEMHLCLLANQLKKSMRRHILRIILGLKKMSTILS
jgi:hypothetical protein